MIRLHTLTRVTERLGGAIVFKHFTIPHYRLDLVTGMGELLERATYITQVKGCRARHKYFRIDYDGVLVVSAGYQWDFGSGPAIDTPVMVAASCAHDALYQAISEGHIPKDCRRAADLTFREILKEGGVGVIRRNYCYLAVRLIGWLFTRPTKGEA